MNHHQNDAAPQKRCCRKKHSCCVGMKTLLFGASLGAVYGMLFAKTAGKDLRDKLKKSKNPVQDFLVAGAEMDLDFIRFLRKKVESFLDGK